MENQFIPYEQALQLKKLGFNEPCFGFYVPLLDNTFELEIILIEKQGKKLISAPTWQQAFDWFREKGIYGYIHEYYEDEVNKNYTFHYHFVSDTIQALIGENSYTFSMYNLTYEEARLELLKKLIKNLKNGNK